MKDNAFYRIAHPYEEDETGMKQLWKNCFLGDEKEFISYYFHERRKNENTYCAFLNEENAEGSMQSPISMLHIIPMHFIMKSARSYKTYTVPVGFIAGVATAPEYRRKGIANALLRAAEENYRGHFAALILSPANEIFYSHAGYETISYRSIHVIEKSDFFKANGLNFNNSTSKKPKAHEIKAIYDRFMSDDLVIKGGFSKTAYSIRSESKFEILLHEYIIDGGIALSNRGAYALGYYSEKSGKREVELNEFAYVDSDSALALIGDLFSYADRLSIPLTITDTLLACERRIEPLNMIRVIDPWLLDALEVKNMTEYKDKLSQMKNVPYSFELY